MYEACLRDGRRHHHRKDTRPKFRERFPIGTSVSWILQYVCLVVLLYENTVQYMNAGRKRESWLVTDGDWMESGDLLLLVSSKRKVMACGDQAASDSIGTRVSAWEILVLRRPFVWQRSRRSPF